MCLIDVLIVVGCDKRKIEKPACSLVQKKKPSTVATPKVPPSCITVNVIKHMLARDDNNISLCDSVNVATVVIKWTTLISQSVSK